VTIGFIFWLLMLLWLVFGLVGVYRPSTDGRLWYAHGLFLFALFFLLGWKVFGWPIQG
jgi:hypothetical protein